MRSHLFLVLALMACGDDGRGGGGIVDAAPRSPEILLGYSTPYDQPFSGQLYPRYEEGEFHEVALAIVVLYPDETTEAAHVEIIRDGDSHEILTEEVPLALQCAGTQETPRSSGARSGGSDAAIAPDAGGCTPDQVIARGTSSIYQICDAESGDGTRFAIAVRVRRSDGTTSVETMTSELLTCNGIEACLAVCPPVSLSSPDGGIDSAP